MHFEPVLNSYLAINVGIRFHNWGLTQNAMNRSMKISYMLHGEVRIYPIPKNKIDSLFFVPGYEFDRSNYSSGNKYDARAYGGESGCIWMFKEGLYLEICDKIGVVQSKIVDVSYVFE